MGLPISDEPLEVIRANECNDCSLASKRFRRVFKELDDYQHTVAEALAALHDSILDRDDHDFYGETKFDLLRTVDAIIAKLGLKVKQ